MPRPPLHALTWSNDRNLYELYTQSRLEQRFQPEEEESWLAWLATQTSFAFRGQSGHLNVHKEARRGAARYWYAYHFTGERTIKRYLGRTVNVTLARLEQQAREMTVASEQSVAPTSLLTSEKPKYHVEPDSPHGGSAEARSEMLLTALPETKLSRPRLPVALVARERLLSLLDAVLDRKLTLLSASAGWGKTTLLSAWASREGRHQHNVAWASLDSLDNDPTRFWVSIILALRTCSPGVGEIALAMLHSPQPPPTSSMLTALLNDLASRVAPTTPVTHTVLIVDDYHLIEEAGIHEALTFFIEHLPDQLHVILASRIDPDLPLSRWRVRGHVAEIRAADLRFTPEEVAGFFEQAIGAGDTLTKDDVHLLERRTEGWAAGLQLAALAMRQREDMSAFVQVFSGSHRYILDYIQEEILQRQPAHVQRFLLRTSVLRRMNAALCAALMDEQARQAALEMLERLERNNLFVVPLDEHRRWYRVHDLFREVLLALLHATEPDFVPQLHLRAARWYEAEGDLREAITHALASEDFSYAASMMERAAEKMWLNGESRTLYRWIMALPDRVVREYARLVLTAALYVLNASASTVEAQQIRARTEAERLMERVEAALQSEVGDASGPGLVEVAGGRGELSAGEEALLRQRLSLLRLWIAGYEATNNRDLEQMRNVCQQMEELDLEDEVIWQMIPLSETFILRAAFLTEGAFLVPMLLDAKKRVIQAGDRFATIKVMQWLAMCHEQAGQLRQVHQECVSALELLQRSEGHAILAGYFYSFLGGVLYNWNRPREAAAMLRTMIEDARAWQQVDLQLTGYIELVIAEIAAGQMAEAQRALVEAQQLVQSPEFEQYRSGVATVSAYLWMVQGNLAAAGDWASSVAFDPSTLLPRDHWEFLILVRIYLAQGRYTRAREELERFSAHLDRPGDIDTAIPFLSLYVVALHGEGKREQEVEVLTRMLSITEPEGYIRVYLDAGEGMREALEGFLVNLCDQETGSPQVSRSFISKLLAAFEQEKRITMKPSGALSMPQPASTQSRTDATATSVLSEPLTQREEEVLRLLMAGASNQEIATQLVISLPTVKKHVSNILGKLGAESRTQAVAHARVWSLLPG